MKLLDGNVVAKKIYDDVRKKVAKIKTKPILAVILVGDDPASHLYVSIKEKKCIEVGIGFKKYTLPANTNQKKIENLIKQLNVDKKITGFIIQLPLPKQLDTYQIISKIDPKKDIDSLHPENLGKLLIGKPTVIPPTPSAILELLKYYKISLSGKNVVMVGYGQLVGKPLTAMIAIANSDATLTICNKFTKNLAEQTKKADILISATGCGHLIKSNMVKKGVIIIDAGTSRVRKSEVRHRRSEDRNQESGIRFPTSDLRCLNLVGDVDFDQVKDIAGYITPPKGGVGPVTVAILIKNLVKLAELKE